MPFVSVGMTSNRKRQLAVSNANVALVGFVNCLPATWIDRDASFSRSRAGGGWGVAERLSLLKKISEMLAGDGTRRAVTKQEMLAHLIETGKVPPGTVLNEKG